MRPALLLLTKVCTYNSSRVIFILPLISTSSKVYFYAISCNWMEFAPRVTCVTHLCSLTKLLVTSGGRISLLIHNQMLLFIVTFSTAIGKQCSSQSSNEIGFPSSRRKFLIKSVRNTKKSNATRIISISVRYLGYRTVLSTNVVNEIGLHIRVYGILN